MSKKRRIIRGSDLVAKTTRRYTCLAKFASDIRLSALLTIRPRRLVQNHVDMAERKIFIERTDSAS